MSAALKSKSFDLTLEPSARLFGRLEALLSTPGKPMTPKIVSIGVKESVRQLQQHASPQEIQVLQGVVKQLSAHVDALAALTGADPERAAAAREDAAVEQALGQAHQGKSPLRASAHSVRLGENAMTQARLAAAATLQARIDDGHYITSAELQAAWQVKRQAVSNALAAGRIFAVVGPSGDNYYPAFYTDASLDRRVVEKVTRALGALPAASKYHFFTSIFTALGKSPLDALRDGHVEQVLAAAASFARN